jgi:hypothetical protein
MNEHSPLTFAAHLDSVVHVLQAFCPVMQWPDELPPSTVGDAAVCNELVCAAYRSLNEGCVAIGVAGSEAVAAQGGGRLSAAGEP